MSVSLALLGLGRENRTNSDRQGLRTRQTVAMLLIGISLTSQPAEFWDGSRQFNGTMFWLEVAGVVLGGFALWVAWWQFGKARKSADAAKTAAESTAEQMSNVSVLVGVTGLAGYAAEVISRLEGGDFGVAATRASDLRYGLAALRSNSRTKNLFKGKRWQEAMTTLRNVEEALSAQASTRLLDFEASRYLTAMRDLRELLSATRASAEESTGEPR